MNGVNDGKGIGSHDKPLTHGISTGSMHTNEGSDESDGIVRNDDDGGETPRMLAINDDEDTTEGGFLSRIEVNTSSSTTPETPWQPSGNWWKDALYFCGPGWLVSIAYVSTATNTMLYVRSSVAMPTPDSHLLALFLHLTNNKGTLIQATTRPIFTRVPRHNTIFCLVFGGPPFCRFMYRYCACAWDIIHNEHWRKFKHTNFENNNPHASGILHGSLQNFQWF